MSDGTIEMKTEIFEMTNDLYRESKLQTLWKDFVI